MKTKSSPQLITLNIISLTLTDTVKTVVSRKKSVLEAYLEAKEEIPNLKSLRWGKVLSTTRVIRYPKN